MLPLSALHPYTVAQLVGFVFECMKADQHAYVGGGGRDLFFPQWLHLQRNEKWYRAGTSSLGLHVNRGTTMQQITTCYTYNKPYDSSRKWAPARQVTDRNQLPSPRVSLMPHGAELRLLKKGLFHWLIFVFRRRLCALLRGASECGGWQNDEGGTKKMRNPIVTNSRRKWSFSAF